ncbi:MAG: cytochrome b/b6 domain-containing protein [Sphingomonadaceae bacterium]|nr:cytochrome b/b6 domain-containing protein [Sphingomonadaceae bacterium]MCP5390861.1 cytochrome b/b6 domain-containing protein [Sphingomonadaceae bacterium]MCP5394617.1 cytochrome b/b6 domain-containing protein [Sphingomonadaceae bacterium]
MADTREALAGEAVSQRYGRLHSILHWILALLVMLLLGAGLILLHNTPDSEPEKVQMLRGHMAMGLLVFAILHYTLFKAYIRRELPAPASSGNAQLDLLAKVVHHGLRLLTLGMVVSGIGMSIMAGLPGIVFGGAADRIPEITQSLPPFKAHALIARILLVVVLLHILGALFHALVKRDGIFRRISPFRR